MKKEIVRHLKNDIKDYKKEVKEDKKLVKKLTKKTHPAKKRFARKVGRVMEEYKEGKLRSGSQKGPVVKKRKQAIAIALSEARNKRKK